MTEYAALRELLAGCGEEAPKKLTWAQKQLRKLRNEMKVPTFEAIAQPHLETFEYCAESRASSTRWGAVREVIDVSGLDEYHPFEFMSEDTILEGESEDSFVKRASTTVLNFWPNTDRPMINGEYAYHVVARIRVAGHYKPQLITFDAPPLRMVRSARVSFPGMPASNAERAIRQYNVIG